MGVQNQVTGYPGLCNSTLLGITRNISQQNGTEIEHVRKDIVSSSENRESITVNYTVSNISPQLNYIFIADILDNFNKSKTKNESIFSKWNIIDRCEICLSVSP